MSNYLIAGVEPTANGNENVTSAPSGAFATGDGIVNIATSHPRLRQRHQLLRWCRSCLGQRLSSGLLHGCFDPRMAVHLEMVMSHLKAAATQGVRDALTAVHFENASFGPPPAADPDDPFRVMRSHLEKMDPGKSSSSCKLSMVTRFNRFAALQEIWCASFEEASVYENLAAHPDVVNLKEQITRVDFVNLEGKKTHTHSENHARIAAA